MAKKTYNHIKPSRRDEENLARFHEVAEKLSTTLEELGVTEEMAMKALARARAEVYEENYGELVPADPQR
jgi:hypothetical protein